MPGARREVLPVVVRRLRGRDIAGLEDILASRDRPDEHARLFATYMALGTADILIAETRDKRVVGYLIYSKHKHDDHVAYELLDMAVAADCKRQGVGSQLLEHVVSHAGRSAMGHHKWKMWADVDESSLGNLEFLRACGLRANPHAPSPLEVPGTYHMERGQLTLEDRVAAAVERLERITGTKWELAEIGADGTSKCRTGNTSAGRIGDPRSLLMRTCSALRFPHVASDALSRLGCNSKVVEDGSVAVPLDAVLAVCALQVPDRKLADDFSTVSEMAGRDYGQADPLPLVDRRNPQRRDTERGR